MSYTPTGAVSLLLRFLDSLTVCQKTSFLTHWTKDGEHCSPPLVALSGEFDAGRKNYYMINSGRRYSNSRVFCAQHKNAGKVSARARIAAGRLRLPAVRSPKGTFPAKVLTKNGAIGKIILYIKWVISIF